MLDRTLSRLTAHNITASVDVLLVHLHIIHNYDDRCKGDYQGNL